MAEEDVVTGFEPGLVYGYVDETGLLIDVILFDKNDTTTPEIIKVEKNASAYHEIDPEVYILKPGNLRWNGTYWEKP